MVDDTVLEDESTDTGIVEAPDETWERLLT
jgi:hypothetical protein